MRSEHWIFVGMHGLAMADIKGPEGHVEAITISLTWWLSYTLRGWTVHRRKLILISMRRRARSRLDQLMITSYYRHGAFKIHPNDFLNLMRFG